MKRVLVAGAAGYLGRYVVAELKQRGYAVRAFVRDSGKLKQPGPSMEPAIFDMVDEVFTGDATKPVTLEGLCDGVDIVFSSMGVTKPDSPFTPDEVDHLGNRRILEIAMKAGVTKFVYVSVFRAEEMPESAVVRAHEDFVNELKVSGIDYAVIRPNGYFSDMAQFLKMARKGRIFWLGEGTNRINPIHGADLAEVCVDGIEGDAKEIDAGGPEMFTFSSLFELAFRMAGRKPEITFLPLWIGEAALGVIRLFSPKLAGMASFMVEVNRMDNDAPMYGSKRLEDFFQLMVEKG